MGYGGGVSCSPCESERLIIVFGFNDSGFNSEPDSVVEEQSGSFTPVSAMGDSEPVARVADGASESVVDEPATAPDTQSGKPQDSPVEADKPEDSPVKKKHGLSKVSEASVRRLVQMVHVVEAEESHVKVAQELSGSRSSDSGVLVAGLTGRKSVERVANVVRVVKLAGEGDSALAGALVSVEFLRDKQLASVVCRVVGLLAGERVVPSSVVARDAVRVVEVVRASGVDMVSVVSGLLYR